MSNPLDAASAAAFSGITISDGPGAASMSSLMASLSSDFAKSALTRSNPSVTPATNSAKPTSAKSSSKTSSASTKNAPTSGTMNTSNSNAPTTLITSVSQSSQGASPVVTTPSSGTVTNAASNTSGAAITKESSCTGVSCSSGLQAAVAIPIVAAVLGILALLFLCRRRRRRRDADTSMSEKPKKPGKKWSRHLRAFSFDAELLMGGRFSSSNSTRSRGVGSTRSDHNSVRSVQPSIQSIEEVAPPYRDAVSHAEAPQMSQPGTGAGVAGAVSPVTAQRTQPSSTSPEPPPYGSVMANRPRTPKTPTSERDPFADSHTHSPVEGSPFNDPPDEDDHTIPPGSEAASIREAQIGRQLSVMSGGRTIDDVRHSS